MPTELIVRIQFWRRAKSSEFSVTREQEQREEPQHYPKDCGERKKATLQSPWNRHLYQSLASE